MDGVLTFFLSLGSLLGCFFFPFFFSSHLLCIMIDDSGERGKCSCGSDHGYNTFFFFHIPYSLFAGAMLHWCIFTVTLNCNTHQLLVYMSRTYTCTQARLDVTVCNSLFNFRIFSTPPPWVLGGWMVAVVRTRGKKEMEEGAYSSMYDTSTTQHGEKC